MTCSVTISVTSVTYCVTGVTYCVTCRVTVSVTGVTITFCKKKIPHRNCCIYKKGKNWYCVIDDIIITVNSNTFTVIIAH